MKTPGSDEEILTEAVQVLTKQVEMWQDFYKKQNRHNISVELEQLKKWIEEWAEQ